MSQLTWKLMLCLICVSYSLLGVRGMLLGSNHSYWQIHCMALVMTASAQLVVLNDITTFMVLNAEGVEAQLFYAINCFSPVGP